jgi:hydrogenase nickel incorporation protein HypA/HybF
VHELAVAESVVETICDRIGDRRVALVRLEIGELAGVTVDALRNGFDVCAHGTIVDGAALEIDRIAARARCNSCGNTEPIASFACACTCGSFDRELVSGDELRLKEVELY